MSRDADPQRRAHLHRRALRRRGHRRSGTLQGLPRLGATGASWCTTGDGRRTSRSWGVTTDSVSRAREGAWCCVRTESTITSVIAVTTETGGEIGIAATAGHRSGGGPARRAVSRSASAAGNAAGLDQQPDSSGAAPSSSGLCRRRDRACSAAVHGVLLSVGPMPEARLEQHKEEIVGEGRIACQAEVVLEDELHASPCDRGLQEWLPLAADAFVHDGAVACNGPVARGGFDHTGEPSRRTPMTAGVSSESPRKIEMDVPSGMGLAIECLVQLLRPGKRLCEMVVSDPVALFTRLDFGEKIADLPASLGEIRPTRSVPKWRCRTDRSALASPNRRPAWRVLGRS